MSSHRRALRAPLALVCVLALLLAACGDADGSGAALSTEIDATAVGPVSDTFGVEVDGAAGEAPSITLPGGEPPAELVVVDLIEGDGAVVEPGATVTTHYTGVSWLNDGEQFDSSWDRGEPATFPLDGVIPGWTRGIPGMKVGGRRLLIIPPDQGYGEAGRPPAIPPNDTLVFVIDLTDIG